MTIPAEYLNQIVTGDARELAERLPDASVDLIFTDPIYERIEDYAWLAETAARVLKLGGSLLTSIGIGFLPDVLNAMMPYLTYRWQFIEYRTNEVKHRHAPGGKCVYSPMLWFDKGKRRPSFVLDVRAISVFGSGKVSNHEWSKPPLTVTYYMNAFTAPGAIVLDPFVGGGTTASAAKSLGLSFIAFELDPTRADRARARVAATQVMHPVLLEEQQPMELEAA